MLNQLIILFELFYQTNNFFILQKHKSCKTIHLKKSVCYLWKATDLCLTILIELASQKKSGLKLVSDHFKHFLF